MVELSKDYYKDKQFKEGYEAGVEDFHSKHNVNRFDMVTDRHRFKGWTAGFYAAQNDSPNSSGIQFRHGYNVPTLT